MRDPMFSRFYRTPTCKGQTTKHIATAYTAVSSGKNYSFTHITHTKDISHRDGRGLTYYTELSCLLDK